MGTCLYPNVDSDIWYRDLFVCTYVYTIHTLQKSRTQIAYLELSSICLCRALEQVSPSSFCVGVWLFERFEGMGSVDMTVTTT